jgi:hypothetical protein
MSSLSLARGRQGQFCSRSLLVTAIFFGLSAAAFGDTINTISAGTDPFITYSTSADAAECQGFGSVACAVDNTNAPIFSSDTDEQYFAFTLDGTYETYLYTSGFFYGGFAPVLSLYYQAPPVVVVGGPAYTGSGPSPYANYNLIGASNLGGPPCNLPTAVGSPTGAIDSGIGYNGQCQDEDLTQVLGPGSYLLVLTEYGNTAEGPTLGNPYDPSNPYAAGGFNLGGTGNFTSNTNYGGCGTAAPNSAFNLDNIDCSAAAQGGNWITTIDTVTSPEPEPGVLIIIGTLLIFGSRRALSSFRNRQEK